MTSEEAILHMTLRREELKYSVSDLDEDIKAFDMAIKALEQEPKSGRWIYQNNERNSFVNVYTCSVCGWKKDSCRGLMQDTGHNLFCEHCGAKMI